MIGTILLTIGCSKVEKDSAIAATVLGTWKEKGHPYNEFTLDSNNLFQKGFPIVVGDNIKSYICCGKIYIKYRNIVKEPDSAYLVPNFLNNSEMELDINGFYNKKFVR